MSGSHKDQRKHRKKVGGSSKGEAEHRKRKKRRKQRRPFKSDRPVAATPEKQGE